MALQLSVLQWNIWLFAILTRNGWKIKWENNFKNKCTIQISWNALVTRENYILLCLKNLYQDKFKVAIIFNNNLKLTMKNLNEQACKTLISSSVANKAECFAR